MPIILESNLDDSIAPLTSVEKDLIHKLRAMLKDIPKENIRSLNTLLEAQRGQRWSDEILLIYIQTAVADINAEPPFTVFTTNNVPISWHACVLTGALIFALLAEAIAQNGEAFSYADNGISLNINLATGYQSIAQTLLTGYQTLKKQIKLAYRPHAAAVKDPPNNVRIRSYAQRMWVYR
jgi:hypothetical protein